MNPIQGIIRGEAVLDGDASDGIDVTLYAVTPGWDAITEEDGIVAEPTGEEGSVYITVIGGAPFKSGMVGEAIDFVGNDYRTIVDVLSPTEIRVESIILLENIPIVMAAQESLQVVELDADDVLKITDVFISQEKDSEYALVKDEDVPGQRIVKGRLLEVGSVNIQFATPFICTLNGSLKYFGHDNGLNVCLIHGLLT